MGTARRRTPWFNLIAGLLWIFIAARNLFWPGLLSMYGRHIKEDAWLPSIAGLLFLFAAAKGFYNNRNKPDVEASPAARTLFG
jgi:hypothetical protein